MLVGWLGGEGQGKNTSSGWMYGSDYSGDKNLAWMGVQDLGSGGSGRPKTIRVKSSTTILVSRG